jgi:hypothetical protein
MKKPAQMAAVIRVSVVPFGTVEEMPSELSVIAHRERPMLDAQDYFAIGFIVACAMSAGAMLYVRSKL